MGRPISGNHAIEAVVFERPFSQSSVEFLLTLEQSLAKRYPLFSPIKVVQMRTENSGSKMTEFQAGVSLKQLKKEKKPAWSLKADANNIIITCFEYTRWEEISPQAIDDLVHVINVGADDQNPVHHLTLQTVDRFIEDPEEKYSINLVFNPESRYLTRQAVEAGTLWHVHQGWFQDTGIADGRQLNILNLSTNVTATYGYHHHD